MAVDHPAPSPGPAPGPDSGPALRLALEAIGTELRTIRETLHRDGAGRDPVEKDGLGGLLERIPERIRDVFPHHPPE